MSFIAVTNYSNASTNSAVVNVPTGTADNDIMFALIRQNTAPNSVPSGWAALGDGTGLGGPGAVVSLYYKVASSEPADYTWGFAGAARTGFSVATYRGGFDTADPIDVVSDTTYQTSDTTVRAAGMTVTAANSPLIFFGGAHFTSSQTYTPATVPDTFVEDVDTWDADSRFARHIASVVWSGSGATGDMDATVSSATTDKTAFAVALNPSAGGGGDPEGSLIQGKLLRGGLLLGGVLTR